MINNDVLAVLVFWGVWLAIPILVDGSATVWHLWLSIRMLRRPKPPVLPDHDLPKVSVIIPAYNEQENIGHCLLSLRAQTYPHHLIEIIVVDDGSDDSTPNVVLYNMSNELNQSVLRTNSLIIEAGHFNGVLNLIRRKRDGSVLSGKAAAVNAGLAVMTGELIVALDSDVVLEPDAIEQAVRAFLADPELLAVTGHLIIDPYLIHVYDSDGQLRVDARGIPEVARLSLLQRILTACQFIEYVTAFHLGRRSESAVDGMFTLSGAGAVFRLEAFTEGGNYRARTVSEDTDMTMALHKISGRHIGYLSTMRVHVKPILTLSGLFAQRTRWQRGALEASAVHVDHVPRSHWFFWRVVLPMRLQVDHTLAFPRLVWTFLIWMMPLFGYSWTVVTQALVLLFLFYLLMNTLQLLIGYLFSSPPEKVFIRKYIAYLPVLPLYNTFLFWVRMSAELHTLTEGAQWTVQNRVLEWIETFDLQRATRAVNGLISSLFH